MFKPNKYYVWYTTLIHTAQNKNRKKKKGVYEYDLHHIIPRSLGGSDDKINLVLLTPREHFIAHLLLVRCVGNDEVYRMVAALIRFKKQAKTSRKFELFRKTVSTYSKGSLNASYGKIWCHMKDDIENIIYIKKEDFNPETMNKGLPYQRGGNHNNKWVKKDKDQILVANELVNQYLNEGWTLGRNTKLGIDHMKKMSKVRHSKEKDLEHAEKMRVYHKNNPRKGTKAWIHNGFENMLINITDLPHYESLNWKRGRYK